MRKFRGQRVVSNSNFTPTNSSASGIWGVTEQAIFSSLGVWPSVDPAFGGAVYTNAGTYSLALPSDVFKISIVAIGGGGAGARDPHGYSSGGAGGGLCYINEYVVGADRNLTIVVGAGGYDTGSNGTYGQDSYVQGVQTGTRIVHAYGGEGGYQSSQIAYGRSGYGASGAVARYGGNSGYGTTTDCGGGGGAAGYSGTGGNGGYGSNDNSTAGSGGGGGGGGADSGHNHYAAQGGGGTGIYGQGSDGARGPYGYQSQGGYGGSGGNSGAASYGGWPGGGGGSSYNGTDISGARGAVRIIWGNQRQFPVANVSDLGGESSY